MREYWNTLSLLNKIKFIISVIIGVIAVVFATLNWKMEEVHLLFKKTELPLTLLIIFSMAAGYGISYIFAYRKFRDKEKEIEALKRAVDELRAKSEE